MKAIVLIGMLTAFSMLACTDSGRIAGARQADASYESAVNNQEACCGSYVLITIVNGATGEQRTTCTLSGYQLSSLWMESGLPDTVETSERLRREALQNKHRVFTFYKPEALRNMPITFTDADLAHVREATQGLSPDQALEAMRSGGTLTKLKLQGTDWGGALQDAVACAFVERGASAGEHDFGGLWISVPATAAPASNTTSSAPTSS